MILIARVMEVVGQLVVFTVQRAQILYQTCSLTHILNLMFFSVRASGTLLVHLTLSTNYCSNYLPEWHLQYADSSKALSWLSSSGDYKRTRQEALTALLLYLYKYNMVCATTISTSPYVHASTSCPITKATMPYTCALTSYS